MTKIDMIFLKKEKKKPVNFKKQFNILPPLSSKYFARHGDTAVSLSLDVCGCIYSASGWDK